MEIVNGNSSWEGNNPFFLVIEPDDQSEGNIGIDLDVSGWHGIHAEHMRLPGVWWLYSKEFGKPVASVIVREGDQPYYFVRHVGNLMAGGETVAHGIGKKCADGSMVRIWLTAQGFVCGGDDVDELLARML
jgi:hypothetical protein